MYNENVSQIMSKVIGKPMMDNRERSMVMSGDRGGGPTQAPEQDTLKMLEEARFSLKDAAKQLENDRKTMFSQKMRQDLRDDLLKNPGIQMLEKLQGQRGEDIKSFSTKLDTKGEVPASVLGQLQTEQFSNLQQSANAITGAISKRKGSISQLLQDIADASKEQTALKKQDFETQDSLIKSLLNIREAERKEELLPYEKQKLIDEIQNNKPINFSTLMQNIPQTESFEDYVAQREQQMQQSLGPAAREMLRLEYEKSNPVGAIQKLQQHLPLSGLSKENQRAVQQQVGTLLASGNAQGAIDYVNKIVGGGGELNENQQKALNTLVDNVRQDEDIKNFRKVSGSYQTMVNSAQLASGPGDMALLRAFALLVDPASAVREEEFESMKSAQGALVRRGVSMTKGQISGQQLTPQGRQDFLNAAQGYYNNYLERYNGAIDRTTKQATALEIDPNLILPNLINQSAQTGTAATDFLTEEGF